MNSADHLYVKSAADAWLRDRGKQAVFEFTQPDGIPIGSLVDIHLEHRRLRVHLDQAVTPVWDAECEPVLGVSVPVDRDTLIRRWYVHRIRLDSDGTARHVQIGTEAFARPTEWFGLDDCEMTERGLSTPAVERIVRTRSQPPPSRWSPGKAKPLPEPDALAQALLRRLLYARRVGSLAIAKQVQQEAADLNGVNPEVKDQLDTALRNASAWLHEQETRRHQLLDSLDRAVSEHRTGKVRKLLLRVEAVTAEGRTEAEDIIVTRATDYVASPDFAKHQRIETKAKQEREAIAAAHGIDPILKRLRRYDAYTHELRDQVARLIQRAATAGHHLTADQTHEVQVWQKRAAEHRAPLHKKVAREHWNASSCPRCHAGVGKPCVLAEGTNAGQTRRFPHDERLQPRVDNRKTKQRANQTVTGPRWSASHVTCPDCHRGYNAPCNSPGGFHQSRVEKAAEYTRLGRPRRNT
ncbi:hypothetical protein AB0E04_46015 [Streptomyces sp. NPDC048251]|uniref:zinc finger domain-containing protein n=1 Tax=Streptomyces sp. NPDC048251 TaxID=3154501 RepID=UPI003442E4A5